MPGQKELFLYLKLASGSAWQAWNTDTYAVGTVTLPLARHPLARSVPFDERLSVDSWHRVSVSSP